MELKRFVQLFIVYMISILLPLLVIHGLSIHNFMGQFLLLGILGYIVLAVPLTIMTIRKKK